MSRTDSTDTPTVEAINTPPKAVETRRLLLAARWVVLAMVGLAVVAGAWFAINRLLDRDASIPDSIAGTRRMGGAVSRSFQQQMSAQTEGSGIQPDVAVFGRARRAEFLVVLVNDARRATTEDLFQSYMRGFTQGGAVVGASERRGQLKDAAYRCVSAEGGQVHAGACIWRADDHVGFVVDLDGTLKTAEALTARVYREIAR